MCENAREINEILEELVESGVFNKDRLLAVAIRAIDKHIKSSPESRSFKELMGMIAQHAYYGLDFVSESELSESTETISLRESISGLSDESEWTSDDEETQNGDPDASNSLEEPQQENNLNDAAVESKQVESKPEQNKIEQRQTSGENKVLAEDEPSTSSGYVDNIGWNKRKIVDFYEKRFGLKKQRTIVPSDEDDDSSLD